MVPHLLSSAYETIREKQDIFGYVYYKQGFYLLCGILTSAMEWGHLTKLYNMNRSKTFGLSLIPKLKYEYISLTSFSKMRMDLAVQVYYIM